jgi:hypothetical protein
MSFSDQIILIEHSLARFRSTNVSFYQKLTTKPFNEKALEGARGDKMQTLKGWPFDNLDWGICPLGEGPGPGSGNPT